MTEDARLLTAYHEAGHAWAFGRCDQPVRYVTLRPRTPGAVGRVASSSRRSIDVGARAFIAAAGPIAEALQRMHLTEDEDSPENWDDP